MEECGEMINNRAITKAPLIVRCPFPCDYVGFDCRSCCGTGIMPVPFTEVDGWEKGGDEE